MNYIKIYNFYFKVLFKKILVIIKLNNQRFDIINPTIIISAAHKGHSFHVFQADNRGDSKPPEKRKKESILDLTKYIEKPIRVKFSGGREATGVLKGFDPLLNLVLDTTTEYLRGKQFLHV